MARDVFYAQVVEAESGAQVVYIEDNVNVCACARWNLESGRPGIAGAVDVRGGGGGANGGG